MKRLRRKRRAEPGGQTHIDNYEYRSSRVTLYDVHVLTARAFYSRCVSSEELGSIMLGYINCLENETVAEDRINGVVQGQGGYCDFLEMFARMSLPKPGTQYHSMNESPYGYGHVGSGYVKKRRNSEQTTSVQLPRLEGIPAHNDSQHMIPMVDFPFQCEENVGTHEDITPMIPLENYPVRGPQDIRETREDDRSNMLESEHTPGAGSRSIGGSGPASMPCRLQQQLWEGNRNGKIHSGQEATNNSANRQPPHSVTLEEAGNVSCPAHDDRILEGSSLSGMEVGTMNDVVGVHLESADNDKDRNNNVEVGLVPQPCHELTAQARKQPVITAHGIASEAEPTESNIHGSEQYLVHPNNAKNCVTKLSKISSGPADQGVGRTQLESATENGATSGREHGKDNGNVLIDTQYQSESGPIASPTEGNLAQVSASCANREKLDDDCGVELLEKTTTQLPENAKHTPCAPPVIAEGSRTRNVDELELERSSKSGLATSSPNEFVHSDALPGDRGPTPSENNNTDDGQKTGREDLHEITSIETESLGSQTDDVEGKVNGACALGKQNAADDSVKRVRFDVADAETSGGANTVTEISKVGKKIEQEDERATLLQLQSFLDPSVSEVEFKEHYQKWKRRKDRERSAKETGNAAILEEVRKDANPRRSLRSAVEEFPGSTDKLIETVENADAEALPLGGESNRSHRPHGGRSGNNANRGAGKRGVREAVGGSEEGFPRFFINWCEGKPSYVRAEQAVNVGTYKKWMTEEQNEASISFGLHVLTPSDGIIVCTDTALMSHICRLGPSGKLKGDWVRKHEILRKCRISEPWTSEWYIMPVVSYRKPNEGMEWSLLCIGGISSACRSLLDFGTFKDTEKELLNRIGRTIIIRAGNPVVQETHELAMEKLLLGDFP